MEKKHALTSSLEPTLDEADIAILTEIQNDGRKSLTHIAQSLRLSIGTVRTRLNRLVTEGVVQIIGRVSPDKVGFGTYAHVGVSIRPSTLTEAIAEQIADFPEVSFLAMTSGGYDLEVNVMCRDNHHLKKLVEKISEIEGVYQTQTMVYLKVYRYAQPDLKLLSGDHPPSA